MSALGDAFQSQSDHCTALGSPFMGRLMALLAQEWPLRGPVVDKCAAFSGDVGPAGASVPLRLAGGLHALILSARAPDLALAYPPHTVSDAALCDAVQSAFDTHADFLCDWLDSPPQTNEIRRAAAFIAGAHTALALHPMPLVLSELGASGGINLNWDHYALETPDGILGPAAADVRLSPDWTGPVPVRQKAVVHARRGVDLNPLDLGDPNGLLRASAYLWPDQPQRLANTRAAARLPQAPVDAGDAIDWLEARLQLRQRAVCIWCRIRWLGNISPKPRRIAGAPPSAQPEQKRQPSGHWHGCRWKPMANRPVPQSRCRPGPVARKKRLGALIFMAAGYTGPGRPCAALREVVTYALTKGGSCNMC